jgi:hypothetical protein
VVLTLKLNQLNQHMSSALVHAIYAREGAALQRGAKLMDITVDLGPVMPHDCPPVSHYRLVLSERGWLRELAVSEGDEIEVDGTLAVFTTEPDEPTAGQPVRPIRVTTIGILPEL